MYGIPGYAGCRGKGYTKYIEEKKNISSFFFKYVFLHENKENKKV